MLILRPLYEAWLRRSAEAPLAPWQRQLLLRALERDEELRRLALELAEFNQEDALPAALEAPDLRARLRAQLDAAPRRTAWQPGWGSAALALALLAGLVSLWWTGPSRPGGVQAEVHQTQEAADLRIPSLTPTPTRTASPSATPSATATSTPAPPKP